MRMFCLVLMLGISSTGCNGCAGSEDHPAENSAKPPSNKKTIAISPAMRSILAAQPDAGPGVPP